MCWLAETQLDKVSKIFYWRWQQEIQNWEIFVSAEFCLPGHHRYRRWNGAYITCESEKSGPSKQVAEAQVAENADTTILISF